MSGKNWSEICLIKTISNLNMVKQKLGNILFTRYLYTIFKPTEEGS